jgi:sedoheptulokinase
MYDALPHGHITTLAASGNAVRKNPALQAILSDVFGMPVSVAAAEEEAAFGAAMTAAAGVGLKSASDLARWVRYRET